MVGAAQRHGHVTGRKGLPFIGNGRSFALPTILTSCDNPRTRTRDKRQASFSFDLSDGLPSESATQRKRVATMNQVKTETQGENSEMPRDARSEEAHAKVRRSSDDEEGAQPGNKGEESEAALTRGTLYKQLRRASRNHAVAECRGRSCRLCPHN